ncbi:MAG: hypothetical protein RIR00_71 [Pseudomonadota bacterium]|jgi:protein phosphatase
MNLTETLEIVARTDPGRVRSHNEDSVFASPALGLAILADGMGGYNAGEVASGMATALLSTSLAEAMANGQLSLGANSSYEQVHAFLGERIAEANTAIFRSAQSQPQYAGMGTTLVLSLFFDNRLTVAYLGDSRLYRLRGETLEVLTHDHSFLQEQIDSGVITPEQARFSQNRNLVTRALGVDPLVNPDQFDFAVEAGDIYLLCSDGLNDMVSDEEIALTLQALGANLPLAAEQLVEMANDNGGRDNISVILVKIKGDFAAPRGWWRKLLAWLK